MVCHRQPNDGLRRPVMTMGKNPLSMDGSQGQFFPLLMISIDNFGRQGGGGGCRYRGPRGAAIVVGFFLFLFFELEFFLIVFEMFFKIIIGCGMLYNYLVHIFNLSHLKAIGWLVIFILSMR